MIKEFFITAMPLLVLDVFWLSVTSGSFYKARIGHLLADKFLPIPGAIFYTIFCFGLTYFIVHPAIESKWSLSQVALKGAIFGFVCYATYDLTNQATMKNWSTTVTIVDMIWGLVLSATAVTVAVTILRKI